MFVVVVVHSTGEGNNSGVIFVYFRDTDLFPLFRHFTLRWVILSNWSKMLYQHFSINSNSISGLASVDPGDGFGGTEGSGTYVRQGEGGERNIQEEMGERWVE